MVLLTACGCARYTTPIVAPTKMTPVEKRFQEIWDASAEVLLSYRFTIDRRDRRSGVMTIAPTASKHFFEWWRRDKTDATGALENSVQPMYREVTVQIRKAGEGKYRPVVSVIVSRLLSERSSANRHLSSYQLVSTPDRRDRLVVGLANSEKSRKGMEKYSPGDEILARKIADDIQRLSDQKRTGNTPSAPRRILQHLGR
ncbi:MAG: hypothetical protein GY794_20395 [bacterium]|nr:hypothetical protein [bacterium]